MSRHGFLRHGFSKHASHRWDDDDHGGHGHGHGGFGGYGLHLGWFHWLTKAWHSHGPWGQPGHGGHGGDGNAPLGSESAFGDVGAYRSIDGAGNNSANPDWGSTHTQFIRTAPSDYGDGISTPAGDGRPSAREVSNEVFTQHDLVPNETGASNLLWVWGQFIDHDIDLAAEGASELFPIEVPAGDVYFDPNGDGDKLIMLARSDYDPDTGTATPREQINEITSFIDASNVYGSDAERAAFLRADGGKLKVSDGDYLPYNDGSQHNAGQGGDTAFVAGDVRANENVALTSMHTVFVREHNRLVDELAQDHPDWTDEQLYQNAKAIVEAELQVITYQEFLPLLLGKDTLPAYSGYQADIDPSIANIFAGAAFRVGHTMLSGTLARVEESGEDTAQGALALQHAFFNPSALTDGGGVDPLFRGLAGTMSQEIDTYVIDDVRNFLFGPPGSGGFDLVSLNIQRGRDHGLPDYNSAREAYGLDPVTDFSDITSDTGLQQTLFDLYGSVDNIDLFAGMLAEDHVAGAMVGELVLTIVADQFERLRDGDSFWYENRFGEDAVELLQATTLSDIIMRNTGIEHMQHDALMASERIGGDDGNNTLYGDDGRDLLIGFGGNDKLYGGGETDDLFGDDGNDKLYGGAATDYLHGGSGNDKLFGQAGDDFLYGDDGNDQLNGGAGDDLLAGGRGNDTLTGGGGQNTFLFRLDDVGNGVDQITDFTRGANGDVLDLSDVLAGVDPGDLGDYLGFTRRGQDTEVRIDTEGHGGNRGDVIAVLDNISSVDMDQLIAAGNLIV